MCLIVFVLIGIVAFVIAEFGFLGFIKILCLLVLLGLIAYILPKFFLIYKAQKNNNLSTENLKTLKEMLLSQFPLLGIYFSRSSLLTLSSQKTPNSIRVLAEAISESKNLKLNRTISEKLSKITEQSCIDEICKVWANKRHRDLNNLLIQKDWVASAPVEVRVLTALKTGQLQVVTGGGKEIVEPLLRAFKDRDSEIASRASQSAIVLINLEAKETLCRLVIEQDHQIARQVVLTAQYLPKDPIQKTLFYFLTEQWDKYESLDFDQSLLQKAHELANEQLRTRIAEKLRHAGRVEWLKVIAGARQKKRLEAMTDFEWETTLSVLDNNKQWDEIWKLAQKASAIWSKKLLQKLKQVAWLPKEEQEQVGFERLAQLAQKVLEKIQPTGGLASCQATLIGHTDWVSGVKFSLNERILISCSRDKTIRLWQMPDGKPLATLIGHTNWVSGVKLSSDGQMLVSWSLDETIRLWQMPDGKPLVTLTGHTDCVRGVKFSPDERILVSWSWDKTIRLWQMPDGKPLATLTGHPTWVNDVIFSLDGQMLVSCSKDKTIRLWQMPDGKPLGTLVGHNTLAVLGVIFSPDGRILISWNADDTIRLWQMPDGKPIATLTGHTNWVSGVKFSPDERMLVSWSKDKTIRLWQMPDGKPIATLIGHTGENISVTFSRYEQLLISYCRKEDNTIKMWQMPDGKPIATIPTEYINEWMWVAFNRHEQLLVSFCEEEDNTIKVWRSDLLRLSYIPVGQLNQQDVKFIQESLQKKKITKEERYWLEFMQELSNWHCRFDVELEETPQMINAGEFDIEIEG